MSLIDQPLRYYDPIKQESYVSHKSVSVLHPSKSLPIGIDLPELNLYAIHPAYPAEEPAAGYYWCLCEHPVFDEVTGTYKQDWQQMPIPEPAP